MMHRIEDLLIQEIYTIKQQDSCLYCFFWTQQFDIVHFFFSCLCVGLEGCFFI